MLILFYFPDIFNEIKMPSNKTRFQEKWKNKLDPNGMPYKIWCKKQDDTYAWCEVCESKIKVDGMGICGIKQHALTQFHIKKIGANIEKQIIPNELEVNQQEETGENID